MAESLNPALGARIIGWLRPDWTRTVATRRAVAGGLVILAGAAALRSDPQDNPLAVVVATRDLGPGTALTAGDVTLQSRSATTAPDGAAADLSAVIGAKLAGPARRGEVLTDVRLLGKRLAAATAGPEARIVPVHLADGAVLDLLRSGDVVDVVAAGPADSATEPRIIAAGGIVVLVSDRAKDAADERVVLVALPAAAATAVAGAVLVQTVTLTLR